MKPFNLQEALAHPERVVHRDGTRAIQVVHFPEAHHDSRVVILWEKSKYVCTYTEDGCGYRASGTPALFLSTPPEQVPFTIEGFKAGWEVVYRNGEKPLEVKVFEKMKRDETVVSVRNDNSVRWHRPTGGYYSDDRDHTLDLFLLKPVTT